jgi:hypothetical protein
MRKKGGREDDKPTFLYLSIFIPSLYISLTISISLAISFFLSISVLMHYTGNKSNNSKGGRKICCVLPIYGIMGTLSKNCALLGGKGNTLK